MSPARLAAACAAAVLALPASGTAAVKTIPSWTDATPSTVDITGGTPSTLTITAASDAPNDVVHIVTTKQPRFVSLAEVDGNPATATLTVNASASLHGRFVVDLVASSSDGSTISRTLTLVVHPDMRMVSLVGPGAASRWAYVLLRTVVRSAPRRSARALGAIATATRLDKPNLVLLLNEQRDASGRQWVQVLLAALPNGKTGWVPRSALDNFQVDYTHLVIDRAALTATLFRNGTEIFHAIVGVGRPSAPTPAGNFYIREELRNFGDPFYGPVAFGTSARSETLTDWPGGGFIGIHGTNQPGLLPGRVSHGCVRMRNPDVVRLAKLMPLGTPVTIK